MAIFAIGDPHLGRAVQKPMDIFGPAWAGHSERFFAEWRTTVRERDAVLVPGDISWAMGLADALVDLQDIDALPGHKYMVQGNHDYWWVSLKKLRALPLRTITFIQNDHALADGVAICGTRGWICPGASGWGEDPDHNESIYRRELIRLRLTLASAAQSGAQRIMVMLHYPPVNDRHEPSGFTELVSEYPQVTDVVYGHLHGPGSHAQAFTGQRDGVGYHLVSADYLRFVPVQLSP